jgi:hypothetical protein
MSWQKTVVLAGVSLMLSAVLTGLVTLIADHVQSRPTAGVSASRSNDIRPPGSPE